MGTGDHPMTSDAIAARYELGDGSDGTGKETLNATQILEMLPAGGKLQYQLYSNVSNTGKKVMIRCDEDIRECYSRFFVFPERKHADAFIVYLNARGVTEYVSPDSY